MLTGENKLLHGEATQEQLGASPLLEINVFVLNEQFVRSSIYTAEKSGKPRN
jgi:hypothetical protein